MNILNQKGALRMVLQFSCSNHKSIKDKIIFSAIAGSDNTFEEGLKPFSNWFLLLVPNKYVLIKYVFNKRCVQSNQP